MGYHRRPKFYWTGPGPLRDPKLGDLDCRIVRPRRRFCRLVDGPALARQLGESNFPSVSLPNGVRCKEAELTGELRTTQEEEGDEIRPVRWLSCNVATKVRLVCLPKRPGEASPAKEGRVPYHRIEAVPNPVEEHLRERQRP